MKNGILNYGYCCNRAGSDNFKSERINVLSQLSHILKHNIPMIVVPYHFFCSRHIKSSDMKSQVNVEIQYSQLEVGKFDSHWHR